ncbi:LuxR C-terminal-related transcriptional regulator [Streptomyces sp. NBC_00249]|uniref:helix-turn-helix transcriptional regulator n=1 Tax=Streptomyces sp. NBC_00249 TaxID=2975690 RepID=UPI00224D686E|nr:LuxR family transcriptional regulator [Streptomyces sp. NBC_00249]MCX5195597.1 LuxR C-terminal-related transcriptional regulator [Streptomyces sp. NBC_00249]
MAVTGGTVGAHGPTRSLDVHTAELDALLRHAADARAGAARAVLVRGPAGIGRSHLLAVAGERLAAEGTAVRRATGLPEGTSMVRAVDTLLGPPPGPRDTHGDRHRFHRRTLDLLAGGPTALVVDDAQWCDETSLRCVDFILRRSAGRPLLVVLAQRTGAPGPGTRVLTEILAQDRCALLELGPLDEGGTQRMVTRIFGAPADQPFVRHCAEITGGNPLLLDRLLRALRTVGIPPGADALHQLSSLHQTVLTALVPEFLAAGPRPARQVATALAVLGRADADPLAALSGLSGRRVESALSWLRHIEAVPPGSPPRMREGIRTAVLAALDGPELQRLRVRAARVLSDAGHPAAEVAAQLAQLDRIDEPWMFAVLRDALAEAPTRATVSAAGRWLRGPGRRLPATRRADLHVELARAASRTAVAPAHALWHLRQALAVTPGPRERAPVAVKYAMMALGTARAPEALRLLERVLHDLRAATGAGEEPADREVRVTVESALLASAVNDRTALPSARARAAALPVPGGHSPADRRLLAALSAFAALDGGSAGRAAALARQALRADEPGTAGWGVFCSSAVLALADCVDEALTALDQALSPAETHPPLWPRRAALAGRSLILHGIGDVPAAARDAWAAVEVVGPSGAPPFARIALASVLLSQGEARQAATVLDELVRATPDLDRSVWEWHHHLYTRGRILRELGDLEGALDAWRQCGRSQQEAGIANPVLAPWWLPTATTLGRLGRGAEAAALVAAAQERARSWGTPRALGLGLVAQASVVEGRGRTALLAEAVDLLADSPARLELAKAQYQLGRELLVLGDARSARGHLRRAIGLATRCGYHVLAAIARDALVTAGGRMPQLAAVPLDSLTHSERRIASLAGRGHSNKKIAETLFITPRTVEMHLTNVYRKLDVRGRADLPRGLAGRSGAPGRADGLPATP